MSLHYSLESKLTLSDGVMMPVFGLGLSRSKEKAAEDAIICALKTGYILFDTAKRYKNEEEIGNAFKKVEAEFERSNYFVVTKLWNDDHGFDQAKAALKESLRKLKFDYVDLYLIHSPVGRKIIETWRAFVELKKEGLTRSIGVSNFNTYHFEEIKNANLPLPTVNQIELHPWLQQREVVKYCRDNNIAVMGYSPLAKGVKLETGKAPEVDEICSKVNRTTAQVLIRWSVQSGFITIPKSSSEDRIKENANIFDFELSPDDTAKLDALDEGLRVSWNSINTPWEG